MAEPRLPEPPPPAENGNSVHADSEPVEGNEPIEPEDAGSRAWPLLQMLAGLLHGHARLVATVFGAGLLLLLTEGLVLGVVLAMLGNPVGEHTRLLPQGIGGLLPELSLLPRVSLAALILVVLSAGRGLVQYLQSVLTARLQSNIELDLRARLFSQWHRVRIDALQRERSGATLVTFSQHVMQAGRFVLGAADALTALVVMVGYATLAFVVSWQLALVAVILAGLSMLLLRPLSPARNRQASRTLRNQLRDVQAQALETLAAMRTIRVYRREVWSLAQMAEALESYYALFTRTMAQTARARPVYGVLMMVFAGALMIAAAWLLPGSEEERLAQLALFLLLVVRLLGPLQTLVQLQAQWTISAPAIEAIFEMLDEYGRKVIADGTISVGPLQDRIRFEGVAFAYPDSEERALHNVTLEIGHGQVVAVVGTSGSGKTTLINLLCRLYDVDSGRILVDGRDLRSLRLDDWLGRVALVGQDTYLFHDTIEANLRFVRPAASRAEVEMAAQQAQAHAFIQALPDGYQTPIRERGVRLSGGQRQRLALARAFLVEPELLILDEATSELDGATEAAVQGALHALRGRSTLLVIGHRLSTVAHADRIYVLVDGRIVEEGRHEDLMARRSAYYALFAAQENLTVP